MAKVIKADGTEQLVRPARGRVFSLEELQDYCGGYVEKLHLYDGRLMWLNEMGKIYGLPINAQATEIAEEAGVLLANDFIVGDVLLCSEEDVY